MIAVNWRLLLENNGDVAPAISPSLESSGLVYRLELR